jgi:hypothetical protein
MHHNLNNMTRDAVLTSDSIVGVPDTISVLFLPQSDLLREKVITKGINDRTQSFYTLYPKTKSLKIAESMPNVDEHPKNEACTRFR